MRAYGWVRWSLFLIMIFSLEGCRTTQPAKLPINGSLRSAIRGMLIAPDQVSLAEPFELQFRVETMTLRPQATLMITLPPNIEVVSGRLQEIVDLDPAQPSIHRVIIRISTLEQLAQIEACARWTKYDRTGKLIEGDGANDQLFLRLRTAQTVEVAHALFPDMITPVPQNSMSVPSDPSIPRAPTLVPTIGLEPTPYAGPTLTTPSQ